MKNFCVSVILVAMLAVAFPASAILVDAVDEQQSLAMGASYLWMGCAAAWDYEGSNRHRTGSCSLISNNQTDGAWIITAGHAVTDMGGVEFWKIIRYNFQGGYFDAFPRETHSYLPEKCVTAIHDKIFRHPSRDIALVKLEHLVYSASGDLITPPEFYREAINSEQTILFGGAGQSGIPAQGGVGGTGYRDGYDRCCRGVFDYMSPFRPGTAWMDFSRTVPLPGIGCSGDSGGMVCIESGDKVLLAGVLVLVSGSGERTSTAFEFFNYEPTLFEWIEGLIDDNAEHPSSVESWEAYQ
ncbi:MAG: hypothetical protein IT292_02410 [Deltaproteobacteria bacterium]|nr:hypothetical protein [Deltaproteobacteria bacterium]